MTRIEQHLRSRHFDLNLHKAWLDDEGYRATFPLYNLHGQLAGYQQYNPNGDKKNGINRSDMKYFTIAPSFPGIWGLESWYLSKTLFLTEGVFDAARMTSHSVSAVSALSNDPKHLKNWLWLVSLQRPIVVLSDQDAAGQKLAKYGTESYVMQSGKDVGEASEEEIQFLLTKFT